MIWEIILLPWTVTGFIFKYLWSVMLWGLVVFSIHYLVKTHSHKLVSFISRLTNKGKSSDLDIDDYYK